MVSAHLAPFQPQKMLVIIYGGRGWIGQQAQKLLAADGVPFRLAQCRVGTNTESEVLICLFRIISYETLEKAGNLILQNE